MSEGAGASPRHLSRNSSPSSSSSPPTKRVHRKQISSSSVISTSSALPEYRLPDPQISRHTPSSSLAAILDEEEEETVPPPDYSAPAILPLLPRPPSVSSSADADEDEDASGSPNALRTPSPRKRRRIPHQRSNSDTPSRRTLRHSSSYMITVSPPPRHDSDVEDADISLDRLLERSVHALEMSNALLKSSHENRTTFSPIQTVQDTRTPDRDSTLDSMFIAQYLSRRALAEEQEADMNELFRGVAHLLAEGDGLSQSAPSTSALYTHMPDPPASGDFAPFMRSSSSGRGRGRTRPPPPSAFPSHPSSTSHRSYSPHASNSAATSDLTSPSLTAPSHYTRPSSRQEHKARGNHTHHTPPPSAGLVPAAPTVTDTSFAPSTPAYNLLSSIVTRSAAASSDSAATSREMSRRILSGPSSKGSRPGGGLRPPSPSIGLYEDEDEEDDYVSISHRPTEEDVSRARIYAWATASSTDLRTPSPYSPSSNVLSPPPPPSAFARMRESRVRRRSTDDLRSSSSQPFPSISSTTPSVPHSQSQPFPRSHLQPVISPKFFQPQKTPTKKQPTISSSSPASSGRGTPMPPSAKPSDPPAPPKPTPPTTTETLRTLLARHAAAVTAASPAPSEVAKGKRRTTITTNPTLLLPKSPPVGALVGLHVGGGGEGEEGMTKVVDMPAFVPGVGAEKERRSSPLVFPFGRFGGAGVSASASKKDVKGKGKGKEKANRKEARRSLSADSVRDLMKGGEEGNRSGESPLWNGFGGGGKRWMEWFGGPSRDSSPAPSVDPKGVNERRMVRSRLESTATLKGRAGMEYAQKQMDEWMV